MIPDFITGSSNGEADTVMVSHPPFYGRHRLYFILLINLTGRRQTGNGRFFMNCDSTHPLKYYLAPMEGLTTYVFRRAYHKYFGGIDKYFTPFIANRSLSSRERNELLPEHNVGMRLVPQILTNRADEFLEIAGQAADYGYDTVNLNLGCPSGTVTAKKRGAGFLEFPEELKIFLDTVYERCPIKVSIKTRIGVRDIGEWEQLLKLYAGYPMEELIVHPRLQKEFYTGRPHRDAFRRAKEQLSVPLCYNGDIVSPESLASLLKELPSVDTVMIGRGVLQYPYLPGQLKSGAVSGSAENSLSTLRAFHGELLEGYREIMSGDLPTLHKMKDFWTFFSCGFESPERYLKKIRKAVKIADYQAAVNELFQACGYRPFTLAGRV